ncbi:MAG: glycosyltransferase family 2 protein [Lachnospiraceae bacterium]|nr:glycosyltransferase family 2 protein [Lachnospiraceae bacterium]
MRELIYVKYNNKRKPEFRTSIKIYSEGNNKIVKKQPLGKASVSHVNNIFGLYDNYNDMYDEVVLLKPEKEHDSVLFPYVDGKSLESIIMSNKDDENGIINAIKKYEKIIMGVSKKYKSKFCVTDKFRDFFGDIPGVEMCKGMGVNVANFDSCFDNFIVSDNVIYSIDYEWIFNILVPERFVLYRAIKMFYLKCLTNSRRAMKCDNIVEFIKACGIDEDEQNVYEQMDDRFQCYVHDIDRRAIYTNNYVKKNTGIEELESRILLQNNHIDNLNGIIDAKEGQINALEGVIHNNKILIDDLTETASVYRRELRNPFYAMYRVLRKVAYKILPGVAVRALQVLKNEGFCALFYRFNQRRTSNNEYERWIIEKEKEERFDGDCNNQEYRPLISVLMPVYNVSERLLTECIESVINQTYDNWQLCMADDCSTMPGVRKVLKKYEDNPKIDIVYREENGHISKATNSALEVARGEFIALLDCDDLLTSNALYEVVKVLNDNRELDYIYSDEDKIDENSKNRHMPHFKPDWSPDTLMSNMYTCHLSVYRKSIIDKVGGFRVGYEGSQDYDLCLRVTEIIPASHIAHISKILYHWRVIESSTSADTSAKPYILEAAFKAKTDAVRRRGLKAELELIDGIYQYRVNYKPVNNDKVSIIIPSKDNSGVLSRCLESIEKLTKYRNYEIVIVDNGSAAEEKSIYEQLSLKYKCKYIYKPDTFNFSRMCNTGAAYSTGDYLLFLNDDMEIIDGEWLERMLGQAQIDYAGAVGAKLLYPDSKLIQHIGVINILNGPTHALSGYSDDIIHYFGRNVLDYNYSAVTAACLMVNKDKFNQVNGFNENFAVAYNDVDFCFKLIEAGFYNVVRNDVVLYHYESYSRGDDLIDEGKLKRLNSEREELYRKHPDFAPGECMDRFYNRFLAQGRNDFSNNYELQVSRPEKYSVKKLSDYKECSKLVVNIDRVRIKDYIKIDGWCYKHHSKFNNLKKPKVLVIDGDTVYEFNTKKVYRPDVSAIPEHKRMAMTGFTCESEKCFDKKKQYKVAIALGKKYKIIDV